MFYPYRDQLLYKILKIKFKRPTLKVQFTSQVQMSDSEFWPGKVQRVFVLNRAQFKVQNEFQVIFSEKRYLHPRIEHSPRCWTAPPLTSLTITLVTFFIIIVRPVKKSFFRWFLLFIVTVIRIGKKSSFCR